MKKITFCLFLMCCSLLSIQAQNQETTAKFRGNTYESLAGTGKYIYLYNVGTGKFLTPGKSWGTEAALIYEDFGLALTLTGTSNGNYTLNSTFSGTGMGSTIGIDTGRGAQNNVRPTAAEIFVDRSTGTNYKFEQVETTDGTIVYYVMLHMNDRDVDCHLFAGATTDENSIEMLPPTDEDNKKDEVLFTEKKDDYLNEGGIDKDFQWMLISRDDLVAALKEKATDRTSAVIPDATFYITNQGFARGNNAEWQKSEGLTYVRRQDGDSFLNHLDNATNGQYFFTHINGTGFMYQNIDLSVPGIYRFRCNGFIGTSDETVRMYAWVDTDNDGVRDEDEMVYKVLYKAEKPYSINNEGNGEDVIALGKELYDDGNYGNFLNELTFYVSSKNINGNSTIQIGFQKIEGNEGTTPNTIDNVRLHYLGENPLILDDTETDGTYLTDEATYPHNSIQVYLKRNFRVGTWNTLVLPIDVTRSQLENVFANGFIVAEAATSGLADDNYKAIWFKTKTMPTANNAIALEKGKFYLIYPKGATYNTVGEVNILRTQEEGANAIGTVKQTINFVDNNTNVGLIDLGAHSTVGMLTPTTNGIDVTSDNLYPTTFSTSEHNAIQYNGTFTKHEKNNSPVGGENGPAYVFVQKKANLVQTTSTEDKCEMRYITNQTEIRGFRWWITDVDQNASSGAKAAYIAIDGVLDENETTSIGSTFVAEGNAPSGIYSASGMLVRNGTSLKGLQPGLYIVNGRKVLVK